MEKGIEEAVLTVEQKVVAEFDELKAKLAKAISDYDHRLFQHFEDAKANVLGHFGITVPSATPTAAPAASGTVASPGPAPAPPAPVAAASGTVTATPAA